MDYRIKDLPKEERPREKLEERGSPALTDVELLSLVLRTGIKGKNVKELASEILNSYSLKDLSNRSLDQLQEFEGVSRVKAGQLKAVGELSKRMQNEDKQKIESFSDVKKMAQDMKYLEEEKLRVFYLSSGNKLLEKTEIDGSPDSVGFKPREVFEPGLRNNATAVILVHNHPSGKSEPTKEDYSATKELIEAGKTLGIDVLDHIIIGESASSMRASETKKIEF